MKPSDALRQSLASLISQAEAAVATKQQPIRARIAMLSGIKVDDRQREVAELTREAVTADNPVEVLRRAAAILVDMELQEAAAGLGRAAGDSMKPALRELEKPIAMANALHYSVSAAFEMARKAAMMMQTAGPENYTQTSIAKHLTAQISACRKQAEEIGAATGVDVAQFVTDLESFATHVSELEGAI